jgi:hypothetical protein
MANAPGSAGLYRDWPGHSRRLATLPGSSQPGGFPAILGKALAGRGVRVIAAISLNAEDTKDPDAGDALLRQIVAADPIRDMDEETTGREQQNVRDVKS